MASTDPELRARIANNARAANWERLLNAVDPQRVMKDDERHYAAETLRRQELAASGRKGSDTYRRRAEEQRAFLEQRDRLIVQAELLVEMLRDAGTVA